MQIRAALLKKCILLILFCVAGTASAENIFYINKITSDTRVIEMTDEYEDDGFALYGIADNGGANCPCRAFLLIYVKNEFNKPQEVIERKLWVNYQFGAPNKITSIDIVPL